MVLKFFKETFKISDRLYITLIDSEFEGDTYFPEFNQNDWTIVSKEKGLKDEKNPFDYYFIVFDKN